MGSNQQQASNERLMRVDEVANLVGVTSHTIGVWIREGRIPSKRLGGARRFVRSEIDEWIRAGGPTVAKSQGEAQGAAH
jgi:excisionase family DNA binding protein